MNVMKISRKIESYILIPTYFIPTALVLSGFFPIFNAIFLNIRWLSLFQSH